MRALIILQDIHEIDIWKCQEVLGRFPLQTEAIRTGQSTSYQALPKPTHLLLSAFPGDCR